MNPYIHRPELFRSHFSGQGMPGFEGARMQRGAGPWMGKLKRFAVPLLMAGMKTAAPHISKVARNVTGAAAQRLFPNSPAMQHVASDLAGRLTDNVVGRVVKRKNKKKRQQPYTVKRRKASKQITLPNIFQ